MAGDRRASRNIKGGNKTLLTINERPVLSYVLSALLDSKYVRNILIVGPKKRIEKALKSDLARIKDRKITVLEQWDNLIENVWHGFLHTIEGYKEGVDPDTYLNTPEEEKAVLALSGDIPLLTSYEIDEFFENAEIDRFDYIAGITPDHFLMPYYPKKNKPGIRHSYFHAREIKWRHNNLHLGRLFKVRNKIYIQKMYEYRHQREWKDIIKLIFTILRTEKGTYKAFYQFAVLQACMFLTNRRFGWLSDFIRKFVTLSSIENTVGLLLGVSAKTSITYYGGAALDIDSDEELETIKTNLDEWMAYQKELFNSKKGESKKGK
ncbi:MAG: nucleotidyltransferase family protein [Deltaproteobacteria bacterium]|uniref:Nucleotidyltransferase family protein n=1 Tax=Candidatus Zymogenus saltonus TaxID=2844893 RepID=A0A9D8KCI0_9DELT|nr:nucleotidyltransferase family protein [Candidatus Zymogenus saltonus]